MAFGSTNTDHLSVPDYYSSGPTAGPGEVFFSSLRRGLEVDSAFGMQVNLRDSYQNSINLASKATGRTDLTPNWPFALDAIGAGIQRSAGVKPSNVALGDATLNTYLADIDRIDAALTAAKQVDPNVKTFTELFNQELINRKKIIEESVSAMARSNGNPIEVGAESFLASAISGLDPQRNPLFFASMFVGGGGASLLTKMVTEGLIGAGAMGAQDLMFTTPTAKMLGEQPPDMFNDLLFGFVMAAGARGLFEGASPAFRAARDQVEGRFAPQRAQARAVSDMLSGEPNFAALDTPGTRLTDEQLLHAAQLLRDTPEKVAAEAQHISDMMTKDLAPGTSRQDFINAQEGSAAALDVLEQARPMNPQSVLFPEGISQEQVLADAVANSPELKARVDALDARIADAQQRLDITLEQQKLFNEGKAAPGEPTFDSMIEKVRTHFNDQMAELELVRKESKVSPDNPKIVLEKARIEKQAKDELQKVASVRFFTDRMLKDEVAKARRTIRDQNRLKQKVITDLGIPEKVKTSKASTVHATDTANTDKIAKAEDVTSDARVEPVVAKMEESLKTPPEAKRPPAMTPEQTKGLSFARQSIEAMWAAASKDADLVRKVEAGAAAQKTAKQVYSDNKAQVDKLIPQVPYEVNGTDMVRAVRGKLGIPSMDQKAEFAKWLEDYNLRTKPTGHEMGPKAQRVLKEQGLDEQFKLSLKGEADKPLLEVMGRDVQVDLEVNGRSALEVFDEIKDEQAMFIESTNCAKPPGGGQ